MEASITETFQNSSHLNIYVKIGLVALVPQWCRTVLIIFMTIVFFTGLPGNTIVIIVQTRIKRKTSTDWFVIFLAICDIISLVLCVPVYIIIMKQWWPSIGSNFGCRFHNFVLHMTFAASTIIIATIGIDRLWKTKLPSQQFTATRVLYCAIFTFGLAMALGIMAAFSTNNNILGHCIYDPSRKVLQTILYLTIVIIVTIASFIICYSYIHIVFILKSRMKIHPPQNGEESAERPNTVTAAFSVRQFGQAVRTTKLMFLVTVVFIVSAIIPTIAVTSLTTTNYRDNANGRIVIFFLTRLYLFNNCANPYFYIWLNTAFRKRTFSIFKSVYLLC